MAFRLRAIITTETKALIYRVRLPTVDLLRVPYSTTAAVWKKKDAFQYSDRLESLLSVKPSAPSPAVKSDKPLLPNVKSAAAVKEVPKAMEDDVDEDEDTDVDQSDVESEDDESAVNVTESLRQLAGIKIKESDLEEKFIKGSGNGGQKINKTSSCVQLKHIPTGILVKCQETRSLQQNRDRAREILARKLDDIHKGKTGASSIAAAKIRKQKSRRKRRQRERTTETASTGGS